MSSSPDNGTMLPEGLPHVAVILLWYPLFTQPFIFRDIEALKKHLPVTAYTLYGANLAHCSEEMRKAADSVRKLGTRKIPAILASFSREFCARPVAILKAMAKTLFAPWNNLEVLGENIWALYAGIHLAREIRESGADILYAPWPRGTATAARVVSMLTGIPYATSARGDNLNPADPDLVRKLRDALFIRANNAADKKRIIDMTGIPEKRIPLVYNSLTLNVDSLAPLRMDKTIRILAVGRFDLTKGFDVLVKACGILKREGRTFSLTLVGGGGTHMGLGHMTETILKLRKSLDLEKEITLPGIVSHDQLPALLKSHDVFAAPCVIHESGRRDGIPNTVIEAMSFGLPVVASNINALPEVVHDRKTGLLVEQKDPEALARALAFLMDHPETAREFGREGARVARDMFSSESNGRRLANLFVEAMPGRHRVCAE